MINQNEFTINSRKDLVFKVGKINAIQMLALDSFVDFDKLENIEKCYDFILKHIEVKIADTWQPVKSKDFEIYTPNGIENDYLALRELCMYFLINVLKPLFTKSKELNENIK